MPLLVIDTAISIHAPLRERRGRKWLSQQQISISIHAPLRERRCTVPHFGAESQISIHAPLRERLNSDPVMKKALLISIHAPLRERHIVFRLGVNGLEFQSTLPYGSDLMPVCLSYARHSISIHAPLRERRVTLCVPLRF